MPDYVTQKSTLQASKSIQSSLSSTTETHAACDRFWSSVHDLQPWIRDLRSSLQDFDAATMYTPVRIDPNVGRLARVRMDEACGYFLGWGGEGGGGREQD